MASRDLKSRIKAEQSFAPQAITDTVEGTGIDLLGFESALILILLGAWTDGTHTFEVQESEDDITYTAVADAQLNGTEPVIDADDDAKVIEIGYEGWKRYVRVKVTEETASTGLIAGAYVIKGSPEAVPAA